MPITINKILLSGSTDGRSIGVTATQGVTYNTIHTAQSGATSTIDEVYLYAVNNFSETLWLALEIGSSQTQNTMMVDIPAKVGPQLVLPGLLLLGSATAANDIVAYVGNPGGLSQSLATSGNTPLSVYGYVNRITQT